MNGGGRDFGRAVDAYEQFRPSYPLELFTYLVNKDVVGFPRTLAVDLGAGTGLSSLPLLEWFADVTAIEPDPAMATQLAIHGGPRLKVLCRSAEDAELPEGTIDMVTAGNAFYWMDGPKIAARVGSWLRSGGVFAVYRYSFPQADDAADGIIRDELAKHWDKHRHERLRDEEYSYRVLKESQLRIEDVRKIPNCIRLTPEQLVGFISSTSYGSAYLRTLSDKPSYLHDLASRLRRATSGRTIPVDFSLELIVTRR